MKVLFLPFNIASIPSITSDALNKVPGVEAKCLVLSLNPYQSLNNHTVYLPNNISKKNFIKWLFNRVTYNYRLKKLIRWADVLHYTWSSALPDDRDLLWAKQYNKPVFVEWLGSDIRVPEYLYGHNPYYEEAVRKKHEYIDLESFEKSDANQAKFIGACTLVCPEMSLFLNKNITRNYRIIFQRINCSDFKPVYPSVATTRPLIVHSPTASIVKGTDLILQVIEDLEREYDFEFTLIQNMSRSEALVIKSKADIVLDQIIGGSYGMAALEAMSQGKPVMCYLMKKVFEVGLPAVCPVINTNPDTLREQLIRMITSPQLRYETGIRSRQYVETYHDACKLAVDLKELYKEAIMKSKSNKTWQTA